MATVKKPVNRKPPVTPVPSAVITWNVEKASAHEAPVPAGLYQATVVRVEDQPMPPEKVRGNDPVLWRWIFDCVTADGETVELSALSSRNLKAGSKALRWVERLVGEQPDGPFSFSVLAGKPCLIDIEVEVKENGSWSRVRDVLPSIAMSTASAGQSDVEGVDDVP
jgi:hypothetical protein